MVGGSPPRMWGIRNQGSIDPLFFRITPTYVGNTQEHPEGKKIDWDHPHVCGEYNRNQDQKPILQGSPPRMWGIRVPSHRSAAWARITPTYVGNTGMHLVNDNHLMDHPHVCGEYSKRSQPLRHPYNFSFPFFMSCIASCNVAVASDSASCGWRFSIWYSANTVANL